jgi:hypothetical protein
MLGVLAVSNVCAQTALAQNGSLDSIFATIPFHEWFTETGPAAGQTRIHWSAQIDRPVLSVHQRLFSRVEFSIDGAEIARRRGKGSLLMLIEIEDQQGRLWQDHDSINLESVDPGVKRNTIQYLQSFFVTPGEYRASFAVYDSASGEHSVIRRNFHANPLRDDPFERAWRSLPAIEFIGPSSPPDSWYLPFVRSRVDIKASAREPVTLDVVVNLTPSEHLEGSTRIQSRNLSQLIPSTKVLSQIQWTNVTVNVSLLDLARRRIVFEQNDVRRINWRRARASLGETNPGLIDVKALEEQKHEADFFVSSIRQKAEDAAASHSSHVLIVLSSPVGFEQDQSLHPMEPIAHSGLKTYYIRYQPLSPITTAELGRMGRQHLPPREYGPLIDQLEPLLKPMEPKLFDVTTPEEFRRALAAILAEIEKI